MKRLKPIDEYCRVRLGSGKGLASGLVHLGGRCLYKTHLWPSVSWLGVRGVGDCRLEGITPEAGPLSAAVGLGITTRALPLLEGIHVYKILGQTPSTSLGVKCRRDWSVVFAGGRRIISLLFF